MYGYGGPVKHFWRAGWNCFDFFIVVVGMVMMTGQVRRSLILTFT